MHLASDEHRFFPASARGGRTKELRAAGFDAMNGQEVAQNRGWFNRLGPSRQLAPCDHSPQRTTEERGGNAQSNPLCTGLRPSVTSVAK